MSGARIDSEPESGSNGDLPSDGARLERQRLAAELARLNDAYERTLRVGEQASDPRALRAAFDEGDRLQSQLLRTLRRLRRCGGEELGRPVSPGVLARLDSRRAVGRLDGHERRDTQPPPEAA